MKKVINAKFKVKKFKAAMLMLLVIFSLTSCRNVATQKPVNMKSDAQYNSAFSQLESDYDVKLGIYALDTEMNKEVAYHADDRFAYCSTFKALAAGAVLKQDSLDELKQVVKYKKEDVLSYAPIAKDNVDKGMTIEEICNAAVRFSDNTAANLLFNHIGGPSGFKSALNQIGDNVTQPARIEPELNEAMPGDIRDTSTPRQLATDLQAYTTGNILTDDKKRILIDWMTGNATGNTLIRAGAPDNWVVADKSGTGPYGTRNDIAIVMPPNKKPIIIAILSTHHTKEAKYDDKLIAQVSKIVFDSFTTTENNN
ncbi:TPA: class A beta-lactamase [Clostridium botulinum]|uniref:Beta-lactamase n=1 Tax=Clostridium botulinum TaxID=1491 RepID=A0ABC8CUR0_CLOBO|nr:MULTISPECIES: class A beta-lactamase [Clostridium]AUM96107.1 class A beta-lactamase [Clostridium sporogenes]AVQ39391.1 class A beta-lactamase [Clostridium botulinum]AVQ53556.1 class A beta-lactamase [Clostridium botulinum]MCW6110326.1 class A beta-lactamase [Clostridium sporogenes]HBJ2613216.1 class A beta-lactamase [Clostridium botulinum]